MARRGQIIESPVVGDRTILHETSADSQGRRLKLEVIIAPGAKGPPEHIHPLQEERFEVLSGRVGARVEGEERTLQAGEALTARPEPGIRGGVPPRTRLASWSR